MDFFFHFRDFWKWVVNRDMFVLLQQSSSKRKKDPRCFARYDFLDCPCMRYAYLPVDSHIRIPFVGAGLQIPRFPPTPKIHSGDAYFGSEGIFPEGWCLQLEWGNDGFFIPFSVPSLSWKSSDISPFSRISMAKRYDLWLTRKLKQFLFPSQYPTTSTPYFQQMDSRASSVRIDFDSLRLPVQSFFSNRKTISLCSSAFFCPVNMDTIYWQFRSNLLQ